MNCGKRELFFLLYLLEKILLPRANTTYLLQICIKGGRFSRTLNSHLLKFVQVGINNNVLVFMQLRHFFVKMSFCLRPYFPLCLLYCNFKLSFYNAFVHSSNTFFCPFVLGTIQHKQRHKYILDLLFADTYIYFSSSQFNKKYLGKY